MYLLFSYLLAVIYRTKFMIIYVKKEDKKTFKNWDLCGLLIVETNVDNLGQLSHV